MHDPSAAAVNAGRDGGLSSIPTLPGCRPSFSPEKGEAVGAAERLVDDLDPVARPDGVAEPDVRDVGVGSLRDQ